MFKRLITTDKTNCIKKHNMNVQDFPEKYHVDKIGNKLISSLAWQ